MDDRSLAAEKESSTRGDDAGRSSPHTRGGWEQLVYEQAPRPYPWAGEALVAVQAASVTSGELGWDATWTDSIDGTGHDRTPIIPSHEMSGVVAVLGEGVTGLTVGDEVYGLIPFTRDGAAAEYVAVPANVLAAKPVSVDHIRAAAAPLAGLTAWQALVDHAQLTAGQHVLIQGGTRGRGFLRRADRSRAGGQGHRHSVGPR